MSLLFSDPLASTPLPIMIGTVSVALVLIVVTRGRLGYQPRYSHPGEDLDEEKAVTR